MTKDHPSGGLLITVLGAVVLGFSLFFPWYGVSLTPIGVGLVQEHIAEVAQQYGNSNFQALVHEHEADLSALAGRQLETVSAHRILKNGSLLLLVLAGIALLASLLRLADIRAVPFATGGQIALVGGLAFFVVALRMLWRPGTADGLLSLSLGWGIWLALLSAAAVVAGGLASGSAPAHRRRLPTQGPGPPPVARDVASPLVIFQERP